MSRMLITAQMLADRGACLASQRRLKELFPDGVVPTEELIRKHVGNFAWSWAIMLLLKGEHLARASEEEEIVLTARDKASNAAYAAHDESTDDNRYRVLANALDEIYQKSHLDVALIFLKHFIAQNSEDDGIVKTLRITPAYLAELDACDAYQGVFQRLFPMGVEVTVEEAVRHSDTFDWAWAVRHILDHSLPSGQGAQLAADKAYTDYCEKIDNASMIFRNSGHQENYRLRADEARKLYKRHVARIFAETFLVQGGRELMESEKRTSNGVELTDTVLDGLAEEAERGYDIDMLKPRERK